MEQIDSLMDQIEREENSKEFIDDINNDDYGYDDIAQN